MQRIEPQFTWTDVVLPQQELAVLHDLAAQARSLGDPASESTGSPVPRIVALFSGPSGTGKTVAAEVLAQDLKAPLYRIDLAEVVSKYIGETEKNLAKIFTGVETGAILLFDEGDALFGKRSEVKDSHDRYANIEISYLLQKAENFSGMIILAESSPQNAPGMPPQIDFVVNFTESE